MNAFKLLITCSILAILQACSSDGITPPTVADASAETSVVNQSITPITFSTTGTIDSCTVSPTLPTGLSIMSSNCTISGTATVVTATTVFTVTATNGGGNNTATVSITITPQPATFSIRAINLTLLQPLSPIIVVAHNSSARIFEDGVVASVALEQMAEGGSNAQIAGSIPAASLITSTSLSGPLAGLGTATLTLTIADDRLLSDMRVTALGMLTNTNDAFTGFNSVNISNLTMGQSMIINGPTWDAGTEANSEAQGTMPGPVDGGEGFNAARDDQPNLVRFHTGIVSNADDQSQLNFPSILTEKHRFDNPSSRFIITRTQ